MFMKYLLLVLERYVSPVLVAALVRVIGFAPPFAKSNAGKNLIRR